jgi:hypothetical protein
MSDFYKQLGKYRLLIHEHQQHLSALYRRALPLQQHSTAEELEIYTEELEKVCAAIEFLDSQVYAIWTHFLTKSDPDFMLRSQKTPPSVLARPVHVEATHASTPSDCDNDHAAASISSPEVMSPAAQ